MNINSFFVLLFFFVLEAKEFFPDLSRDLHSESITQTRQIEIPCHPSAYNPSIVPYKNGYLLSFRIRDHIPREFRAFRTDASFIGLVRLDKHFDVIENSVQLLSIRSYDSLFSLYAEDGRLIKIGERIFLIFNDLHPFQASDGFQMYLAEIVEEDRRMQIKGSAIPLIYPKAIQIEKNWSPFVFKDSLYLIYSDFPRVILEVDLMSGECREIIRTSKGKPWKYGSVRGGTPACLIDDYYVTFFHTRVCRQRADGKETFNYIMGAYAFQPDFPFAIQKMTQVPVGDPSYYSEDNSKKVVFPCGMVVEGDKIYVAWGKNDNRVYLSAFDKKQLFALMDLWSPEEK